MAFYVPDAIFFLFIIYSFISAGLEHILIRIERRPLNYKQTSKQTQAFNVIGALLSNHTALLMCITLHANRCCY